MLPDLLSLGPFIIRSNWLMIMIGSIAGIVLMKQQAKRVIPDQAEPWDNAVTGALLFFVLVWKLSPALTKPSLIWNDPASLLFMVPGTTGLVLGGAVALIYLVITVRRLNINWTVALDLSPFFWAPVLFLYNLMIPRIGQATALPWGIHYKGSSASYHPIHWYDAVVAAVVIIVIYRNRRHISEGIVLAKALIITGIGSLFISLFHTTADHIAGLTFSQWFNLMLIAAGYLLLRQFNRTGSVENEQKDI